jgi:hypothetical protein
MFTIGHADEYAGQLTNEAGYDVAEVVRHGRKVEGDDAAGWATSRGLPLEHHTSDDEWRRMLLLLNAAPDLLHALKMCREWMSALTTPADCWPLEAAQMAITKAQEGIDARV